MKDMFNRMSAGMTISIGILMAAACVTLWGIDPIAGLAMGLPTGVYVAAAAHNHAPTMV